VPFHFGERTVIFIKPHFLSEDAVISIENLVSYSPIQFQLVEQILVFGFACQAAGFIYFLTTSKSVRPKYQLASILGSIVMISAFLLLFHQWQSWNNTFTLVDGMYVRDAGTFTNGFRYLNWAIDVPLLLIQLVIVLGLTSSDSMAKGRNFVILGLLMIFTGYIGQVYETSNMPMFWSWFFISSLFFVIILRIIWTEIGKSFETLPESAVCTMKMIRWIFVIVWSFYPIAYLVPAFTDAASGVVWRQFIFTIADVVSKVIYGVMITKVAQDRSLAEGYLPTKQWFGLDDSDVK
jgi:bacteriorhodopsin